MSRLTPPSLERDQGTIRSTDFDDIYYSPEDGLAESRYVFVDGNDLPLRLRQGDHPLNVAELGFGTGLNILALLAEDHEAGHRPLNIWSCEGFPLSQDAFRTEQARIAKIWPEIAPFAEPLAKAYPVPVPGQTQVALSPGVMLTLSFGPVGEALKAASFLADAWFLDGFAPSKNPEMWSPAVMAEIARLSGPGATAATFSVASGVREALTAAGFSWNKTPGFGRKKHMLKAQLQEHSTPSKARPWFIEPKSAPAGKVAIIGAGIAGATLAQALLDQDRDAAVFGTGSRAEAASGNPGGLIMPRIDADDTPAARFYRDAFLYAERYYQRHTPEAFDPCGGTLPMDPARFESITKVGLWPDDVFQLEDNTLTCRLAGVLRPVEATAKLLSGHEGIEAEATSLEDDQEGWWVTTGGGQRHGPFATVVIATGASQNLWPGSAIKPSMGQVDLFEGTPPERISTDGTYVAPLGELVMAGATYQVWDGGIPTPTEENTRANMESARSLLGHRVGAPVQARASLRATTPDRHPIAGPLYDEQVARAAYAGLTQGKKQIYPPAPYQPGLFALTGLGSRGLVTAPILAAHVTALITGGISPLTSDIAEIVHPGRFLIRDVKRGRI